MLKEYASYYYLVDVISVQLNVDPPKKCMKIKYNVEGNDTPMEIHNDMAVQVYVQLKKSILNLEYFPCV